MPKPVNYTIEQITAIQEEAIAEFTRQRAEHVKRIHQRFDSCRSKIVELNHTLFWSRRILEYRQATIAETPEHAAYAKILVENSEKEIPRVESAIKIEKRRLKKIKNRVRSLKKFSPEDETRGILALTHQLTIAGEIE